jgi:Protein of unknown function (DUF1592)/Protein of unknown function (DUF1588)/Protein of unknown function (DUF1585)/Protein of unknown function (DUF1587)/Protein of unknown function (DUF1595)/Planctomycete cytochrome C
MTIQRRSAHRIFRLLIVGCAAAALLRLQGAPQESMSPRAVFDKYCITCHSEKTHTAGVNLESLDVTRLSANPELVERVIAKLRAGSMPPPGAPRPDAETYRSMATLLEREMDRAWVANPNPGRIGAVHRLNRAEYNNAIRDLLALDIDVKPLLPGDDTADGSFDNFADSLSISTAHLERYMSVARQVTRLATGLPPINPTIDTYEIPLHVLQEERQSEELPFGSRGGIAVNHDFPVAGEYTIKVRLQRQYQDYIKGMGWPQQLDVRVDGKLVRRFEVGGKAVGRPAAASYAGDGEPGFAGDDSWEKYMQIEGDARLSVNIPMTAGPHRVGVSFVRELWEPEGLPQPLQRGRVITNDQVYMGYANVAQIQVGGPYKKDGAQANNTPSRRAIFICEPKNASEERTCANKILSRIARLAYRRPATEQDVLTLLEFFDQGRQEGKNFEAGIQFALERMLVDPDFLLRVIREPVASKQASTQNSTYRLSDLELASRLSFFLWSSIPDDRLLSLAERGQLTNAQNLEKEVRRMMADPRAADTLVGNFAAQWLNLRRVPEVVVDPIVYPNYDLSLLQGFQQETEMFIASTIREDRPLADLINADYTFVNERLARHYGIPGVYGSRFRRVILPNHDERGGLLAQGALLATTSYPERTSPVLRGKWLLNNILGLPIPPPPPGVDTNIDNKPGAAKTLRERLTEHRKNPACNACHASIDPLGFTLENFDVIGGWRNVDEFGHAVDATGVTVNGKKIEGLPGLRALLLDDPEQFPRTVTQKLMAYALGRRLEFYDEPAVRKVVRDAGPQEYRWSSIVLGVIKSPSFLTRSYSTQQLKSAAR